LQYDEYQKIICDKVSYEFKISVIVPVYNTGKFIDETICSILNQSISGVEIILVDDGNTYFS